MRRGLKAFKVRLRVRVRVEFRVRARFAEPVPSFAQSQVLEHDVNSRLLVRVGVRECSGCTLTAP